MCTQIGLYSLASTTIPLLPSTSTQLSSSKLTTPFIPSIVLSHSSLNDNYVYSTIPSSLGTQLSETFIEQSTKVLSTNSMESAKDTQSNLSSSTVPMAILDTLSLTSFVQTNLATTHKSLPSENHSSDVTSSIKSLYTSTSVVSTAFAPAIKITRNVIKSTTTVTTLTVDIDMTIIDITNQLTTFTSSKVVFVNLT